MITVVTAKTNDIIYERCLGAGLKMQNVKFKLLFEDETLSAPEARNKLLPQLNTKYIAFIHQDVRMLEDTWLQRAEGFCDQLGDKLGIAGVAGKGWGGQVVGHIIHFYQPKISTMYHGKSYPAHLYSDGQFTKPRRAMTLDGMVQIIPLKVFKKLQYDEKIMSECAVDYCLAVKWYLNKTTYCLPLKTWHAEGKIGHGYVKRFAGKSTKIANQLLRDKWKGKFNVFFSTMDPFPNPRPKKPFTMIETLDYKQIRIVIVGTGAMGRGIAQVIRKNDNMRVVGIADINPEALERTKPFAPDAKVTTNPYELLSMKPDVLIEASTAIYDAAILIKQALKKQIRVVLMNSEVDQLYGRLLARIAESNNTFITSDAGDQYGVLLRLIDDVKMMGLEIVMAGNNKGYLDKYANPTIQKVECEKRRLNLKPCTAYTDGTKLAIEMAITANALDLKLLQRGMVGLRANHVNDALKLFDLNKARELGGVVDYVLRAQPSGSVFVIAYSNNPEDKFFLNYYKMGKGPYYLFLRPYHLCHYETPIAIRRVMEGKPILVQNKRVLEVGAYAKKDLDAGTKLDGIGGYHLYGLLEEPSNIPIGLTNGVILKKFKKKDEPIEWDDVEFPENDPRLVLWNEQGDKD